MSSKKIGLILFILLTAVFYNVSVLGEETVKKKFVFIKDDDSEFFNNFAKFIGGKIREKGYTEDKLEFKVMSMRGKGSNGQEILKEVKEYNPEVVFVNGVYIKEIVVPLKEANIPTVVTGNIDYLDESGKPVFLNDLKMPNGSAVGVFATLENIEFNSFNAMEMIDPLKNRKIALLIGNEIPNVKKIEKAVKEFGAELSVYKKVKYVEEMQKTIDKVNRDKKIGWVLMYPPFNRKDGKELNREETFKLLYTALEKPNITYWENDVERGAMLAITNDSEGMVMQCLDMTYKILEGEKPQNIKPEYPKKSFLIINDASAQKMGIKLSKVIREGAWRVYTDYEGHYEGHKK